MHNVLQEPQGVHKALLGLHLVVKQLQAGAPRQRGDHRRPLAEQAVPALVEKAGHEIDRAAEARGEQQLLVELLGVLGGAHRQHRVRAEELPGGEIGAFKGRVDVADEPGSGAGEGAEAEFVQHVEGVDFQVANVGRDRALGGDAPAVAASGDGCGVRRLGADRWVEVADMSRRVAQRVPLGTVAHLGVLPPVGAGDDQLIHGLPAQNGPAAVDLLVVGAVDAEEQVVGDAVPVHPKADGAQAQPVFDQGDVDDSVESVVGAAALADPGKVGA